MLQREESGRGFPGRIFGEGLDAPEGGVWAGFSRSVTMDQSGNFMLDGGQAACVCRFLTMGRLAGNNAEEKRSIGS